MPRKKREAFPAPASPPPLVTAPIVDPLKLYTLATLRAELGIPETAAGAEIRAGRLRASFRRGKYYITGEWLMAWVKAGEVRSASASNGRPRLGTARRPS